MLIQDCYGKYLVDRRSFRVPVETTEILVICLDELGQVIKENKWSNAVSVDSLHCKLHHIRDKTDDANAQVNQGPIQDQAVDQPAAGTA